MVDQFPLWVYLLILVVMTGSMSPIIRWLDSSSWFANQVRKLLDHSSWTYSQLKVSAVGVFYYLLPLIFILVMWLLTGVNPFAFLLIGLRYWWVIPLAILAKFSHNTLMSTVLATIRPDIEWLAVIGGIPWVSRLKLRHPSIQWMVTPTSAFFEEMFFRGVVFGTTVTLYPELGFWFATGLSIVLFTIQQASFCTSVNQAVALGAGAFVISLASCIAFGISGSVLPSVLAHQAFLIFYTGKFRIY